MMEPTNQGDRRSRWAPWFTAVTIAVAIAYVYMARLPGLYDKDWVHLWTAGRMVATGQGAALYEPALHYAILQETYGGDVPSGMWPARNQEHGVFFYPPPAGLFYAAFGWMARAPACTVHALMCVLLAVYSGRLLNRLTGDGVPWGLSTLMILAFPPFFANYSIGQNAMVTMAIVLTAWWLVEHDRELLAGCVLGLLICKPNWLLAVGWIPLVHGRWKMVLGTALGGTVVVVATAALLGWDPFVSYFELSRTVVGMHELPGYALRLKSSSLGLFRRCLGIGSAAEVWGWSCAVVVGLVSVAASRGWWKPGTRGFRMMMGCCLMAAMWVNPHLNSYDLMLMSAGAVLMVGEWRWLTVAGRCAVAGVVLLCYVADPWDHSWPYYNAFPVQCFALLAMWGWFVHASVRRTERPA